MLRQVHGGPWQSPPLQAHPSQVPHVLEKVQAHQRLNGVMLAGASFFRDVDL
jgi:hypothetical protein